MKSWKVEAAIIAVGLLLLGIMVKGGINNFVLPVFTKVFLPYVECRQP